MDDASVHLGEVRQNGYTVLRGAVPMNVVEDLRNRTERLHAVAPSLSTDRVPRLNRGHKILYNLQNKDIAFLQVFTRHSVLMPVLRGLLNDQWYRQIPSDQANFILRGLLARDGGEAPLPGHIDSFIPSSGQHCWICQASLLLDPHTEERGSTLVVPGSHLSDAYAPPDALERSVPIIGQPGDIVLWDGRIWHGTRANVTGLSRWAVIGSFCRWWIKPAFQFTQTLPSDAYARLSDEERAIVGFCSDVPKDELERIDIKLGYDDLPSPTPTIKAPTSQ